MEEIKMALYAIGDLHLMFGREVDVPMQKAKLWLNHETYLKENAESMITDDDTLVLCGDHSWGRNLAECMPDLDYILSLPGKKIMLRGNHDMFWDVKATKKLNEKFAGKLFFLQNNFAVYQDYALVGTKGYTYEGLDSPEHAANLVAREAERLKGSLEQAKQAGYTKFIIFLHYPPTNIMERNSIFTKLAEDYGAEQVVYAHCHGEARFHDSIRGKKRGIRYSLVSGECLRWKPLRIL